MTLNHESNTRNGYFRQNYTKKRYYICSSIYDFANWDIASTYATKNISSYMYVYVKKISKNIILVLTYCLNRIPRPPKHIFRFNNGISMLI